MEYIVLRYEAKIGLRDMEEKSEDSAGYGNDIQCEGRQKGKQGKDIGTSLLPLNYSDTNMI
jgi:hypothetical protein